MIEAPRGALPLIGNDNGVNATLTVFTFGAYDQLNGVDAFHVCHEAGSCRCVIPQLCGAVVRFVGKGPAIAQGLGRRSPRQTAIQRCHFTDSNCDDGSRSGKNLDDFLIVRWCSATTTGVAATTIDVAAIAIRTRIDVGIRRGCGIGAASTTTADNLQRQKAHKQK